MRNALKGALALALLLVAGPAEAIDQKVSNMPAASALTGAEQFYCVQGGASKNCTAQQVEAFTESTLNLSNVATGVLSSAHGGAGTVFGALRGNGFGVVTQASCFDLSNAAASCSTDTTNASNISSGVLQSTHGGAGIISGVLAANGSGVVSQGASTGLTDTANLGRLNAIQTWAAANTFSAAATFNSTLTANSIVSTEFPGLSSNVVFSGIPGMDTVGGVAPHWFIYGAPSTFDTTSGLRVARVTPQGQSGLAGNTPSAFWANCVANDGNLSYEWCANHTINNNADYSTNAQNMSAAFSSFKKVGTTTYATTGASGTGATATITFPGSKVYAVGTAVKVAGVTPSGYNGTYTVTASGAGSVSYANTTTGAQTVAGTVRSATVSSTWGGYSVCEDDTGDPSPTTSCVGWETDISIQNPNGSGGTLDPNRTRVGIQIGLGANVASTHAGVGLDIGTNGSAIWDNGIYFTGNIGTGVDLSHVTYSTAAILLSSSRQNPIGWLDTSGNYDSTHGFFTEVANDNNWYFNNNSNTNILFRGPSGANRLVLSSTGAAVTGTLSATSTAQAVSFISSAAAPAASACGTSPSVDTNANNAAGAFTTGSSGTPTACTITFATAYPTAAYCTVSPANAAAVGTSVYVSAQSASAFTITLGAGTNSAKYQYVCSGK